MKVALVSRQSQRPPGRANGRSDGRHEGRPSVDTASYAGFQAPRPAGSSVLFAEALFPTA